MLGVDLDLRQLQAFVTTAEELHFGRAAARLCLTQQALSLRVRRLEETLGGSLFVRGHHLVELTDLGRRLLPLTRQTLAAAEEIVAAARLDCRPLRLDTFRPIAGSFLMRWLIDLVDLPLELSSRHSLGTALSALRRAEIDVAFGRVHGLAPSRLEDLAHQPLRFEPLYALMSRRHQLAARSRLRPVDLRSCGIWTPALAGATELDGYLRAFSDHFAVPLAIGPALATLEQVVARIHARTDRVWLIDANAQTAGIADTALIPLVDPTPLYPWSLVWRRRNHHPLLNRLLHTATTTARQEGWLHYEPTTHWLPAEDLAAATAGRP